MIQLHSHILSDRLHLSLEIIFHATTQVQELAHLCEVEEEIAGEEHKTEKQMAAVVFNFLAQRQVRRFHKSARRPHPRYLHTVDGGSQELVVPLDNTEIAADKNKLTRPFIFITEYLADGFATSLLHFIVELGSLRFTQFLDALLSGEVSTAIGFHECQGGEDVGVVNTPAFDDVADCLVVEGKQCLPEACVLVSEIRFHMDVKAVIDENKFRVAIGLAADENVTWMRVAVYQTPKEHLGREEIYHGCHDFLQRQAKASAAVPPTPFVSFWLNLEA